MVVVDPSTLQGVSSVPAAPMVMSSVVGNALPQPGQTNWTLICDAEASWIIVLKKLKAMSKAKLNACIIDADFGGV